MSRPSHVSSPRAHHLGAHRLRPPRPGLSAPGWALRLALRRRSLARRGVAVGAAAVLALAVGGGGRAHGPEAAGTTAVRPAPVAAVDLAAGSVLQPDDVTWVELPADVARVESDPIGAVALEPVAAGEVLRAAQLGSRGRAGLRPDERAVAVSPPTAPLPLAPGDVVELVAVSAAGSGVDGAGGGGVAVNRVAATGRVLAVDDDAITVALPSEVAVDVVGHQARGSIELLLTPWSP